MDEGSVSIIWQSIVLVVLVIFSAYFSAFEAAISATNKFQLETYYKKHKKNFVYKKILFLIDHFQMTISAILTGNNLVAVAASSLSTLLFTNVCRMHGVADAESLAAGLSTGIITAMLLIFGEFLPKSFARLHNIWFIRNTIFLNLACYFLFWPISWLLNLFTSSKNHNNITEEDLHSLVSVIKQEGVLDNREASLVKRAISFDDTKVVNIMTPAKWIQAINVKTRKDQIAKIFIKNQYSRLPVIKNHKYIGMITSKSFFYEMYERKDKFKLKDIIQPVIMVSQHTRLDALLQEMKIKQCHLALIKKNNDSTKVIGLATLENILEYLVGKIYDEHDGDLQVAKINDFTYRVNENYKAMDFFKRYFTDYLSPNMNHDMKTWFKEEFNVPKITKGLKRENDHIIVTITKNKNNSDYFFVIEKKNIN